MSFPRGYRWAHPDLVDPTDMHANVDVPLNELRTTMLAKPGAAAPVFFGSLRSALVLPAGEVPIDSILVDNFGGWNPAIHCYVIPRDGTYLLAGAVRLASGIGWARIDGPFPVAPIAGPGEAIAGGACVVGVQGWQLAKGALVALAFAPLTPSTSIADPAGECTYLSVEAIR